VPHGVEPLPPRHPWEEPPAGGWTSSVGEFGQELVVFLLTCLGAVGAFRLVLIAHRLGQHALTRPLLVLVIAMWCSACVLACSLGVYLWRRHEQISTALAMLTDHGRVARLGGRPPVWLDQAPARGLCIAHLSDLHIAEGDRVRLVERPSPAGNAHVHELLEASKGCELILFTGDITDRGSAVSWRCFLDALAEAGVADRAVLVPGNHDLAYLDVIEGRRGWRHDRFGIVQLANLLKFASAFADTGGGKLGFVLKKGDAVPYLDEWHEVEREVRPMVAELPSLPVPPLTLWHYRRERGPFVAYRDRIEHARERLLGLFPIAIPMPGRDAVLFVLNSSSRVSRHPASNALGKIGRMQYARLEKLARMFPRELKLLGVHHHVVRRGEELAEGFLTRVLAKFTVLADPEPLVRFCRRHGVRAVMNGHRHLSYQVRLSSGTVLLAAPSSTLGDELAGDPRAQFERYWFAERAAAPQVGIYREPVRLTAPVAAPIEEAG
jgi:3',5'-cyclic AMP phosphodiesterase CpdA